MSDSKTSTGRGPHASLAKSQVTHAVTAKLNMNGSGLAGIIDNLKSQLAQLDQEIRADVKGKRDFEVQLELLMKRKEAAATRLAENQMWAAKFDEDIGPFERRYQNLTVDIRGLYDNAKLEHLKGLELLMQEFEYHPAFKRHNDTFSAVPFRPK